jgi:hypothetical protein
MTLVEITKNYSTTKNGVTYDFKVGERYEVSVPLGGNYVQAYKLVPSKTNSESGARVLVDIPIGYFAYTSSGVRLEPSKEVNNASTMQTTTSNKSQTNTKYIVLGIVAIGLISLVLIKK